MEISLNDLVQLIKGASGSGANCECKKSVSQDLGQNIVVLDRGFVYVGNVVIDGDFAIIKNAKNIRYWGTNNGLGELVNGPLAETKLDSIGVVRAPMRAVIHFVPCKGF